MNIGHKKREKSSLKLLNYMAKTGQKSASMLAQETKIKLMGMEHISFKNSESNLTPKELIFSGD